MKKNKNILKIIKDYNLLYCKSLAKLPEIRKDLNFKSGIYFFFYFTKGILKSYIGRSKNLAIRINEHLNAAQKGSMKHPKFYNTLRKYGIKKFWLGIITFMNGATLAQMSKKETDLILKFKPSLNCINYETGVTVIWNTLLGGY